MDTFNYSMKEENTHFVEDFTVQFNLSKQLNISHDNTSNVTENGDYPIKKYFGEIPESHHIFLIVFTFALAIFLNSFVIHFYWKSSSSVKPYALVLAVMDISIMTIAFVSLIINLCDLKESIFGKICARIRYFVALPIFLFCVAPHFFLAIDRFFAVYFPYRFKAIYPRIRVLKIALISPQIVAAFASIYIDKISKSNHNVYIVVRIVIFSHIFLEMVSAVLLYGAMFIKFLLQTRARNIEQPQPMLSNG